MPVRRLTRRDKCWAVGTRAARLTDAQAAKAWRSLAERLLDLGEIDFPQFRDLLEAVRTATIEAKKT